MNQSTIKWKLGEVLEREGLTVYRLHQELSENVSRNTLYRLSNEQPERIELSITANILKALERLSGKSYGITDLLEVIEEAPAGMSAAGVPYTGDPETDAVLDDHPDILERVGRLERGESKTRPLREIMTELGIDP
jgi:hypothetical protein